MKENFIKRKCIACNEIKDRNDLIKITVDKNKNVVEVMPDNLFFGRSAYVCKSCECVQKALKKDKLFKILRIKPDDILKEKIRAVLES